jgi:hypothetical protein
LLIGTKLIKDYSTLKNLIKKQSMRFVKVAKHANAATFASALLEKFFPQFSQNNSFWFF